MADHAITKGRHELAPIEGADTNPAAVYLASLAPTGRRTMASTLANVARLLGYELATCPWHQLRYEHVQALRTKLAETYKPATVNKYLCAIRRVLQEAWRLGQLDTETYRLVSDVANVTGSTLPAGRGLGTGEIMALMGACQMDPTPAGLRDGAILAIAYGAGLRRAEMSALDLAHLVDDDGDTITVKVLGKRSKERLVYLDNGAAVAIRDWLATRGDAAGPLFYSGRRGGRLIESQRMSPQAIRDVVARRAEQAKIESCSTHDLRRSFVSDLLDAGADIATVAAMAGHASIETTRRYDRRGETAKKRAARSLHVPYTKRRLA